MASAEQKENLLTSEMTLRSALQFLNVPGEVIRKADEILSEIPNPEIIMIIITIVMQNRQI